LLIADGWFNISVGDQGAAIGTGGAWSLPTSHVETLTILNGEFELTALAHGAAIGTGLAVENATNSIGTVLIVNGTFKCKGGRNGAGVGLGRAEAFGQSVMDNLTILGREWDITAHEAGAAIGAPFPASGGTVSFGHLGVHGGNFKLSGYSGIGASAVAEVSSIVIGGPEHLSISCLSIVGTSCLSGPRIEMEGAISIDTTTERLAATESIAVSAGSSLFVKYSGASTYEGILGHGLLHIALIPPIRSEEVDFSVKSVSATPGVAQFDQRFELSLSSVRSFMMSVKENEKYEITMAGIPAHSHTIMSCNG
jgi:hypothetical protein